MKIERYTHAAAGTPTSKSIPVLLSAGVAHDRP
jgi:hypothetical protein